MSRLQPAVSRDEVAGLILCWSTLPTFDASQASEAVDALLVQARLPPVITEVCKIVRLVLNTHIYDTCL